MKKTRSLLNVIFGIALSIAFALTLVSCTEVPAGPVENDPWKAADDLGITETKDNYQLQEIALSGMYKTEFKLGENFSSDGLIVTAKYIDKSTEDNKVVEEKVSSDKYQVDFKDYLAKQVGTYNIIVSYTHKDITKTKMYSVNVSARDLVFGGIVAKLAEGQTDKYTLTAEVTSVTISKDILAVYEVDSEGRVKETPIAKDLYTAQLYLGSKKIEENTANENGIYSFTVFLNSDKSIQDFINVYVSSPVTGIELIKDEDNLFEQEASSTDIISNTWSFKLTYSNGFTKTVAAGDLGLEIDLDTTQAGNDKTATITFKEADASGEEHTVTCTIKYTITAKKIEGNSVTYTVSYTAKWTGTAKEGSYETSYSEEVGEDLDKNVNFTNTASNFGNKPKSTEDNSVSLNDYSEIKNGKEVTVVIGENAKDVTITAYVSHTTSTATRTAFIGTSKDGTEPLDTVTIGGDGNPVIKNLHKLVVSNATPGTYYVSSLNDASGSVTIHCYQVVVTYTIAKSTDEPAIYDPVIINFEDLVVPQEATEQSYNAESKANMGTIVFAEDSFVAGIDFVMGTDIVKVKKSNQTITHAGQAYPVTKCYSTQGSAKANSRSILLNLKDSSLEYKVTVYAKSSATTDERQIAYSFDNFTTSQTCDVFVKKEMVASSFTFKGQNSVYFGSNKSGIDIYLIVVEVVTA